MNYTREKFIDMLGVSDLPESFGNDFDIAMKQYESDGVPFIKDSFLDALQNEYGLFSVKFEFVKKAAGLVRKYDFASRYAFLLHRMLQTRANGVFIKIFEAKATGDSELDLALEMAPFFAELAFFSATVANMRNKGVPEDMISRSVLKAFEGSLIASESTLHRDGFNVSTYFGWNQRHLDNKLLTIGIFSFEMKGKFYDDIIVLRNSTGDTKVFAYNADISNDGLFTGSAGQPDVAYFADFKENDTCYEGYEIDTESCKVLPERKALSKSEWSIAVRPQDSVISVHIPKNAAITPENCNDSYRLALEVFGKYFPEFKPKAFICGSWMIDPQLKELLKPTSNILSFQSKYKKFPRKANGQAVFKFVFGRPSGVTVKVENLPEDTSLQRSIKQFYLDGNYIYEQGGIFFADEI